MNQPIKEIEMQGILSIDPLEGSPDWYWGTDYTSGDLYEAEELFRDGHPVVQNKLLFVHYPDGKVLQPVFAQKGQYLGRPIFYEGKLAILLVDFSREKIWILQADAAKKRTDVAAWLPLSTVEDCYNLLLSASPLMLARQGGDDKFQILWPEKTSFFIESSESFLFRNGDRLYFSLWHEDPDYWEETIVRHLKTGEILDRFPGSLRTMPDGQIWALK